MWTEAKMVQVGASGRKSRTMLHRHLRVLVPVADAFAVVAVVGVAVVVGVVGVVVAVVPLCSLCHLGPSPQPQQQLQHG